MRKSSALELTESIAETPNNNKGTCCRLSAIWLMSNVLTFLLGYYVKTTYFKDNCLADEGSSL